MMLIRRSRNEPMDIDSEENLGLMAMDEETDCVKEENTTPVLESIGRLRLMGKSSGRRGAFSTAVRRAITLRDKKQDGLEEQTMATRNQADVGPKLAMRSASCGAKHQPKLFDAQDDDDLQKGANHWNSSGEFGDQKFQASQEATSFHQLPFLLAGYLQLAFNLVIVCVILYAFISFALSVRQDVQLKVDEEIADSRSEIERCRFAFHENRCDDVARIVPRMREQCAQWEACFSKDPAAAYQTRLTAELFAEVINSFIDPISYKTMVFAITLTVAFTLLSNLAFSMAQSKLPPTGTVNAHDKVHAEPRTPVSTPSTPYPHSSQRFHPTTPNTSRRLEFY